MYVCCRNDCMVKGEGYVCLAGKVFVIQGIFVNGLGRPPNNIEHIYIINISFYIERIAYIIWAQILLETLIFSTV